MITVYSKECDDLVQAAILPSLHDPQSPLDAKCFRWWFLLPWWWWLSLVPSISSRRFSKWWPDHRVIREEETSIVSKESESKWCPGWWWWCWRWWFAVSWLWSWWRKKMILEMVVAWHQLIWVYSLVWLLLLWSFFRHRPFPAFLRSFYWVAITWWWASEDEFRPIIFQRLPPVVHTRVKYVPRRQYLQPFDTTCVSSRQNFRFNHSSVSLFSCSLLLFFLGGWDFVTSPTSPCITSSISIRKNSSPLRIVILDGPWEERRRSQWRWWQKESGKSVSESIGQTE